MPSEKIRIGLLLDSFFVPAWIYETLKRIAETEYVTVVLVVKKQGSAAGFKGPAYFIYNLYGKLSRKYSKVRPRAFLKKNAADLFKDVPLLNIVPIAQNNALHI